MGVGQGVAALLLLCILTPAGFFRNRERILRLSYVFVQFLDVGRIVRLLQIKGIGLAACIDWGLRAPST